MNFTAKQKETVILLAKGMSRKEAAFKLGISVKTVDKRLECVEKVLRFSDGARLAHFSVLAGWIQLGETV